MYSFSTACLCMRCVPVSNSEPTTSCLLQRWIKFKFTNLFKISPVHNPETHFCQPSLLNKGHRVHVPGSLWQISPFIWYFSLEPEVSHIHRFWNYSSGFFHILFDNISNSWNFCHGPFTYKKGRYLQDYWEHKQIKKRMNTIRSNMKSKFLENVWRFLSMLSGNY